MEENNNSDLQEGALSENSKTNELVITEEIKFFLTQIAKWGKFLAVVGFVMCGVMVLGGLAFMGAGSLGLGELGLPEGMLGLIYIPFALLYYFPSKYLYDFSIYTKQAIELNDQESITYAFSRLKSMFRFWGILMVIVLAFYSLALVVAVFTGLFT